MFQKSLFITIIISATTIIAASVTLNVATVSTIIVMVAVIIGCYLHRKETQSKPLFSLHLMTALVTAVTGAARAPLEDVVPVSDNPAYQMVTTLQRAQQTSNDGLTHQYENITQGEHDYENVTV